MREHRVVTLAGAGGIGKTQTALQVATALGGAAEVPSVSSASHRSAILRWWPRRSRRRWACKRSEPSVARDALGISQK